MREGDAEVADMGPIAQLDRASVYGTAGWGFKSLWARESKAE